LGDTIGGDWENGEADGAKEPTPGLGNREGQGRQVVEEDAIPEPPCGLDASPWEDGSEEGEEAYSQHGEERKGERGEGDLRLPPGPDGPQDPQEDHHVEQESLRDRVEVGGSGEDDEGEGESEEHEALGQEKIGPLGLGYLYTAHGREHRPYIYSTRRTFAKRFATPRGPVVDKAD
jgi:hypothetical protein